ncbi:hypothetical protein J5N97_002160 [Dioscorea zingiberensis]|uniref:FRIGIDA interacting protein 1 n=1 Tax=Dioscorea zingiberensis TaxID=325984 RepID=A0A9D5D379_9LILI|nr:hypothetical protein J5N97_002160 [Dioscorea zingiberensis]
MEIWKHISAILALPSQESSLAGLLHFQRETEAHCSPSICCCIIWDWYDAARHSVATTYSNFITIDIIEVFPLLETIVVVLLCSLPVALSGYCKEIVMFVEVICAGCFMSLYIGCVHQYNSLNGQPDVLKSLYSALQPSSSLEDLRYHDGGRLSDQQMALLQYQRENLHYLSEEVLRLQECLSKYERSDDGSTPQVDLAHLLASRDQELRALTAEMNQVQSELRLARSLIAERDAEIQQLHLTNKQYVKENERMRSILNEWSARAAKLERALEAERLSNIEVQKSAAKLRNQPAGQSPTH